jgi:hypothetical protein
MITLILLTAFLAQSDPPVAKKCTLEGQVANASTGGPLKHATLRLSPIGQPTPDGPRTAFTSSTDLEGKFVVQDVDSGTYVLRAERVGYIAQNYGARSATAAGARLKLDAGASLKDLLIKLVPQAMIFGKVVDDDGEPVPFTNVQCQRWMFFNGKRQLRPSGGGSSQADGTFVIGGLAAGRIYLSAEYRSNRNLNEIEKAAGKTAQDALLKTYFPNALDVSGAAAIEVTPGADVRGIEIHMRRGRMYEIRGHVQNTTAGPMPEYVNMFIFPKGGDGFPSGNNNAFINGKNTAFQFKNLLPGVYVIQTMQAVVSTTDASGEMKTEARLSGRVEVTVGDTDVENVILPLGAGVEIAGTLRTEGDPSKQSPPLYNVYLQSLEGPNFGSFGGRVSDEGNFRLHGTAPAVYRVNVNGAPDGSYVKAIRFGGEDITGKNLDLTSSAGGEMQVIISPNAADVTGVVRNESGEPAPGVTVQMYLGEDIKRTAVTDQNGGYHLTSLAPGDYRIYAWEDIEPGLGQDPGFRKNFESRAGVAKLEEKGHESVELKLISKDAIETEAAKIR